MIGVRQVLVYGTQAFKRMKDAAINRNILQPLLRLAFVSFAVLIVPSPVSAYIGLLAAEIVLAVAAAWILNRGLPLLGTIGDVNAKELIATAPRLGVEAGGSDEVADLPHLVGRLFRDLQLCDLRGSQSSSERPRLDREHDKPGLHPVGQRSLPPGPSR